ncbi:MAG: hypothetical protein J6K83_06670 [Bacteroidaceae bacterium]|nr:hypothetical protein [Bacteroidaceae bacterium]
MHKIVSCEVNKKQKQNKTFALQIRDKEYIANINILLFVNIGEKYHIFALSSQRVMHCTRQIPRAGIISQQQSAWKARKENYQE